MWLEDKQKREFRATGRIKCVKNESEEEMIV